MKLTYLCCLLLTLPAAVMAADAPVYKDPAAPVEQRVDDLLGRMTLDEKIDELSGINSLDLRPNERLGIPSLKMNDGPLGLRRDQSTAFPAGIAMGSSFDTDLVGLVAGAIAEETLAKGRDMLLGPCINISRVPQGGRNFESFGEDPYLSGSLVVPYVLAMQSKKVITSVKHYALNNQEVERMSVDVRAGERAIHEIYLPAFRSAVKAGAWTIMAAYNKINGHHAAENDYLLNQVLKKQWSFDGFVVSDWGATHSTVESANNGLDVEMPDGEFFGGGKLQAAVKSGKVSEAVIDDKVRRVLRVMFRSGLFERKDADRPPLSVVNSPEHQTIALRMAQEGMVLLKNDGALPVDLTKVRKVALIGPNADKARAGGGSSEVTPFYGVSVLQGLRDRAGDKLDVSFTRGVRMPGEVSPISPGWLYLPKEKGEGHGVWVEYFNNRDLSGKPALERVEASIDHDWGEDPKPAEGLGPNDFSARWSGRLRVPKTGEYELAARSDDGARLWVDGELAADAWVDQPPTTHFKRLKLEAGRDYAVRMEYYQRGGGAVAQLDISEPEQEISEAAAAAAKADLAIVCVGESDELEGEGNDRSDPGLPPGQDELIAAVAAANPNTVVLVQAGSPVIMRPWADKVRAILMEWYPGQEGGHAAADILLGNANPSGKTPVTFIKDWKDSPAYGNYPGHDGRVEYAEGIYVGYRYFGTNNVPVEFPFGHGLSYTTFEYSNLTVNALLAAHEAPSAEVSLDIKNTGGRRGAEVAQLYVREEKPAADRPYKELKGFARVDLAPGETKRVTFKLDKAAFSFYDKQLHDWRVNPGVFTLLAGASSADIRQTGSVTLK